MGYCAEQFHDGVSHCAAGDCVGDRQEARNHAG